MEFIQQNSTVISYKQLFSFAKDETDGTEGMVPWVPRDHQGYQETQEHQVREHDAFLLLFVTNGS